MHDSDSHRTRRQLDKTTSQSVLNLDGVLADELYEELSQGKLFISRYEIVRTLGRGGFGTVVLARDTQLDRMVAIKVPNRARFKSSDLFGSLLQEAKMAANLRHEGIVTVFDVGWAGAMPFIILEYIQGRTLSDLIANETWSHVFAAKLLMEVALALQHAHDEGFIHLDLKPQNILLDNEDRPRISDFGLAVRQRDLAAYSDHVIGTPMYMSPEQATGENHRIDRRTDIWALGVIFYQLLCRQRPFTGDNVSEMIGKITRAEYVPPKNVSPKIPVELDRICVRCMCGRMSQRYHQAEDLAADLAFWLQSESEDSATSLGSGNYLRQMARLSQPIEREVVVSRGLRPYRPEDFRFFARLLPGPYDRNGLPVASNFWIDALKQRELGSAIDVGLIYGPSGCGKSSFVRAGLIPFLGDDVTAIYIDATGPDLETRLASSLKMKYTLLDVDLSLPEMVAEVREYIRVGKAKNQHTKLVIVVDQIEQWLARDLANPENLFVQGLRQCDGVSVQCLLIVRDDFWLPVTRLMNLLDINIMDGENAVLIDSFDANHAKHVLSELGRSMACLPEDDSEVTGSQRRFIDRAIAELSEQGRLYPVRIAIFAELVRKHPWNEATLDRLGGTEGVGVSFLDHSVGSEATAARQVHTDAARRVLAELLPPSGNIKKSAVRREQLLDVSGYRDSHRDFETLMRLLDGELRLLTPVLHHDATDDLESGDSNAPDKQVVAYRLTHDFLVPSIRQWLAREMRAKRGGRQQLLLQEQAMMWADRHSPRYLPSAVEYLMIRSHTRRDEWTNDQSEMMKAAAKRFGRRSLVIAATLLLCAVLAGLLYHQQMQRIRRNDASHLLSSLRGVSADDVPAVIEKLAGVSDFAAQPAFESFQNPELSIRDRVRFGLVCLRQDSHPIEQIVKYIPNAQLDAEDLKVVCGELAAHRDIAVPLIHAELNAASRTQNDLFRLAVVLAQLSPEDPTLKPMANALVNGLLQQSTTDAKIYRELLAPIGRDLLAPLYTQFDEDLDLQSSGTIVSAINRFDVDTTYLVPRLLSSAKATQFRAILDHWSDRSLDVQREIRNYVDAHPELSQNASSQANLAIAAMLTGDGAYVKAIAGNRHSMERACLIEVLNPESVELWRLLKVANQFYDDPDTLSLFVLSLDGYTNRSTSIQQRNQIQQILRMAYQSQGDAELHVAAKLLLQRWGFEASGSENKQAAAQSPDLPNNQTWFIDALGQEMIVLDIPASDKQQPYRIAMGVNEVHVGLVRKFEKAINERFRLKENDTSPATTLSPGNINAFCNWYSDQERIAPHEWCYEANPGSRKTARETPKREALNLQGVRLPTKHEWLTAAGGSGDHWLNGCGATMRQQYAWLRDNSDSSTRSVGQRLPNPNGLIDLYGNAAELTLDVSSFETLTENGNYCAMGGSVLSRIEQFTGDTSRNAVDTRILDSYIGFRVVRTLPSVVDVSADESRQEVSP